MDPPPVKPSPHHPGPGFLSNAGWMLLAEVLGKATSFLFVLFVARELGRAGYGYFSFAIAFTDLFLILGTLGLNTVVVREIARRPGLVSEILRSAGIIRITLGFLGLSAAVAVSALIVPPEVVGVVALVGTAVFIDDLASLLGSLFKAFENARLYAGVTLVNRVVSFGAALTALGAGGGLLAISAAYLVGSVAGFSLSIFVTRSRYGFVHVFGCRASQIRPLLREGLSLGVAGALNLAIFRLDSVMLGVMKGPAQVGLYGVAYRFFDSFLFVAFSLSSVVLPRIARAGRSAATTRDLQMTAALITCFYAPIAVGSIFAGEWLITTLFTERFSEAAKALPWLTGAGVFYGLAYLSRVAVIALDGRAQIVRIAVISLVLNVVLNLVLIPTHGFIGAAIATFCTEVLEAGLTVHVFNRLSSAAPGWRVILVPAVAALLMGGFLLIFDISGGWAVVGGALSFSVFLPLIGLLLAPAEMKSAPGFLRRTSTAGAGKSQEGT